MKEEKSREYMLMLLGNIFATQVLYKSATLILLKEQSNKMTPKDTLLYPDKNAYSTLIRERSYIRW